MSNSAIVVAAGRGTRMGAATGKAFLPIGGQPMVVYSLQTLCRVPSIASIIVVVSAADMRRAQDLLQQLGPQRVPIHLGCGGAERQDSVAAGLSLVAPGVDLVVVHDAARPFVSLACVSACIAAAEAGGAAIVALPARDTVKFADDQPAITRTLDRQHVWLAQTPQVFRTALLQRAYTEARRDGFAATDDAALVERTGATVRIVPGDAVNLKITTPDDLRWAEWYVHSHQTMARGTDR